MFNRVLDKEITCDLENNKLVLFLNEAHEFAQQRNLPKIREWLDTGGWDINEGLFERHSKAIQERKRLNDNEMEDGDE